MSRTARTPRFYVPTSIDVDVPVELDKRISHHLITVLRARTGSEIILFNDGVEYRCALTVNNKHASATVIDKQVSQNESPIHTTLVQAISRGSNMDTSIQKCVELGVNRIQPVYTRHSVPSLNGKRAERKAAHWQSVIMSAAEQSGRAILPELGPAMPLKQYLDDLNIIDNTICWVLSPAAEQQPIQVKVFAHAIVMVGPESGFDEDEVSQITDAGFEPRLLGPRVLRTETAGPTAIATLQVLYGDFQ